MSDWVQDADDVPFMVKVFKAKDSRLGDIPSVSHVDGSGRFHIVFAEPNPRYHALI